MFDEHLVRPCARLRAAGLISALLMFCLGAGLFAPSGFAAAAPEAPNETFAVSTNEAGEAADGLGTAEYSPVSISEDGRFVAFASAAGNLGESGPPGAVEGYVKNLETGKLTLVTRADGPSGEPANEAGIYNLVLSENGRYVLFTSDATNLSSELPGEEPGETHVYRRDLRTGETLLVDRVSHEGAIFSRAAESDTISANGRYVTFTADVANLESESGDHSETTTAVGYLSDLVENTTTAVTRADGAAGELADGERLEGISVSPDGRFVAFSSDADNLTAEDEEGVWEQIYLRELGTNTTTLLSKNAAGKAGVRSSIYPTFSGGEGCYVEFYSDAENLPTPESSSRQVYVVDRCAEPQTIEQVTKDNTHPFVEASSGPWLAAATTPDGGRALFTGHFIGGSGWHLFVHDKAAGTATLLDRASGETGAVANGEAQTFAISANGCRAVFESDASNLGTSVPENSSQVYVRQLKRCAPEPQSVNVRIEGKEETLYEGVLPVTVHKIRALSDLEERNCDGINELDPQNTHPDVTPTLASVEAMESIGEPFDGQWYTGFGDYFITQWGPDRQDEAAGAYWGILVNETFTNVGGCQYQVDGDDQVLWVYDAFNGRPSLAMFPEAAHYTSGPRPTEVTTHVGEPVPLEVVSYDDNTEDIPGEEPSRVGSHPYPGAEVAPVTTSPKGFQRVITSSPETVIANSEGKASVTFNTPGLHRIKATVGEPGHETVIRSNGITVDVLPAVPTKPVTPDDPAQPTPPPAGPPTPAPKQAKVAKPTLDRSDLADGTLKVDWKIIDPGAGVKQWRIETKTLGRKGAKFVTRAHGSKGSAATVQLPRGGRYRVRFALTDKTGHTTRFGLGSVTVPAG
jgi:hypothetical protein